MIREAGEAGMEKTRAAIVTGGASGIGLATVERLVRDGWAVTIADIGTVAGEALAERLRGAGGQVQFVHTDVRHESAVQAMVERSIEAFGRLDGAVNSAGVPQSGRLIHEISADEWNHSIEINLRGMFFCLKHQIAAMWPNGRGAIVALSSPAANKALPGSAAYCAAKSGINGLVRAAAIDCAARNIRVNALLPGPTLTPLAIHAGAKSEFPPDARICPLARWGEPAEIAAVAAWMLSDDASFMTGACVAADGGMLAA
jgi:NAD(P)-dependent dehydrogenase (short-subunit alcohol dehydrogenase family)